MFQANNFCILGIYFLAVSNFALNCCFSMLVYIKFVSYRRNIINPHLLPCNRFRMKYSIFFLMKLFNILVITVHQHLNKLYWWDAKDSVKTEVHHPQNLILVVSVVCLNLAVYQIWWYEHVQFFKYILNLCFNCAIVFSIIKMQCA